MTLFGWDLIVKRCAWCRRFRGLKLARTSGLGLFTSHGLCSRCQAQLEGGA